MFRNIFILGATSLVFLLVGCKNQNQNQNYVQYEPVFFDHNSRNENSMYTVSSEKLCPEHIDNILIVLNYYDVPHVEKDGDIYLPLDVWEDKDIVMNYTKKANDAKWIRDHKTKEQKE